MIYFLLYILIGSVTHGVLEYSDSSDGEPGGFLLALIFWPIFIPFSISLGVTALLKKVLK